MNPLHLDERAAVDSPWGSRLVHGLLYASLIPAIFGSTIAGCVYVDQDLHFRRPVFVGDAVTARVEVVELREVPAKRGSGASSSSHGGPRARQQLVTCSTVITRTASACGRGPLPEVCLDGRARVLLPPPIAPSPSQQPPLR